MSRSTNQQLLFAVLVLTARQLAGQGSSPLRSVEMKVYEIADSGSYYLYRYRTINAPASRGGAATFSLDLSAPAGTGFLTLAWTGRFVHGAAVRGVTGARDHVPVGPVSPANWEAFLNKDATLDWYGSHGGFEGDVDSVAPADSADGFALRSPYLPGIRASWAAPTFRSCCTGLRPGNQSSELENPNPREFRVAGWTVGPTVRPGDLSVDRVRADLTQVCGALRWIADSAACGALHASLDPAAAAAHRGDRATVSETLRAFVDALGTRHRVGQAVSDNAYWLLKVDAEYLLAHL